MQKFTATVTIINGNPYVRPPDDVLTAIFKQAGKDKSPITVRGKLNGAEFQQSLVRYQGDWRLYINIFMAKAAKMEFRKSVTEIVGSEVEIELEFDTKPRIYPMISQFEKALEKDKKAKAAYEKLTSGRQKEILRYLDFLKSEESIQRNIIRLLQHLRDEESDALYPLMHRKQK